MKEFLKALALAPFVLSYRVARCVLNLCWDIAVAFTCLILGHDMYKGICVRCAHCPGHDA